MSRTRYLIFGALALLAGGCTSDVEVGKSDYFTYCAGCHGDTGIGDGRQGRGFTVPPADLTTITQRYGGTFPLADVMSQIDGYTRGTTEMPAFGDALQSGPTVLVDTGDGIATPTPKRLYDLALYIETLQK